MVYFVGAGPGAEDLITVRGMRLIKEADVIIYAGSLVNPGLLEYAGPGCKIYDSAYMTLEQIIDKICVAHGSGLDIVRLHTGDPSIYGAIREQMDALDERQIPYEVCPGVSSMFGAAASLRCEYTLPGVAQSVIISRAEGRTAVPDRESIRSLALHKTTMILFLSSGLAQSVQGELIAGGYEPDCPVAVVYKATWDDEKIIRSTLEKFPKDMEREGIYKTALIIVGSVLDCSYSKSRLYDSSFSTEFRRAATEDN